MALRILADNAACKADDGFDAHFTTVRCIHAQFVMVRIASGLPGNAVIIGGAGFV